MAQIEKRRRIICVICEICGSKTSLRKLKENHKPRRMRSKTPWKSTKIGLPAHYPPSIESSSGTAISLAETERASKTPWCDFPDSINGKCA
jgi:hypothetical protein